MAEACGASPLNISVPSVSDKGWGSFIGASLKCSTLGGGGLVIHLGIGLGRQFETQFAALQSWCGYPQVAGSQGVGQKHQSTFLSERDELSVCAAYRCATGQGSTVVRGHFEQ